MSEDSVESNRKRHCGECVRRRLVCDSTSPACKRCTASGTTCPGYNDPSGFRWLAPGRVTSRSRRGKRPPVDESGSRNDAEVASAATMELGYKTAGANIPRLKMRTEACDLFEAMEYFNTCIYRDLMPLNELAPNPHIYRLSPAHLQIGIGTLPDYLRLSLICMTLSHRINRTRDDLQGNSLAKTFYQYQGTMIRSLRDDISVEHKCTSDVVIAGIMTMLLADIQQGAMPNWRLHLKGVQSVIMLRGGIRALAELDNLRQLVLYFVVVTAISNTTCPATDLVMTSLHLEQLNFILGQESSRTFPSEMCPLPLFAEIIKINHLRMRATHCIPVGQEDFSQEAYQILGVIDTFSPEQWADSKPWSREDWVLIGNVYQTAVAIYCISSLQSLSTLSSSLDGSLRARCAVHGQVLQAFLVEALMSPRIKRFMLWPLVCLGAEAVNGDTATRAFVTQQLSQMSRHIGTYVPLAAKDVLERFWASGKTRWDACFDRPYAFASQIAIDISQVLTPC